MKWSEGGVYGHHDVNVFCSHGKSFVLVGAVSPKDPKGTKEHLVRPGAVVEVEI